MRRNTDYYLLFMFYIVIYSSGITDCAAGKMKGCKC